MEETLGKRIVACRKKLGITQDRLAEQLGVTAQAVSKWENDLSCPDITMLPKLAEIFGTSVDALLGLSAPEPEHAKEAEILDTVHKEAESDGIRLHKDNWEFRWDGGRKSYLGLAIWIILTAAGMFAASYCRISVRFWGLLWTNGLLVFGLLGLFPKFSFFRLGCGLIGGYYLLDMFHIIPSSFGKELMLPAWLLLFGLYLLGRAFRKPVMPHFSVTHNGKAANVSNCTFGEDSFDLSTSFSEKQQMIGLPRLRNGSAEVSFGNLIVDLTGCEEFDEHCSMDADCSFGNLTILVPKSIRAEVDSDASFGCVDIQGNPDSETAAAIFIHADVSFGQITVKYI